MGTIANAKVTHYYNCYNGDFIGCLPYRGALWRFPVSPRLPGKIPVSGKPGGYSSILSLPSSFRMCSMASL